jgi:formylglycine-generating enzyme
MRARASFLTRVGATVALLGLGASCTQILGLEERGFDPSLADAAAEPGGDGAPQADAEQSDGPPQADAQCDAPRPDAPADARPQRDAQQDAQTDVQSDASHPRCPTECTGSTPTCADGTCVAAPPSCATLEPSCGPFGTWGCCDWNDVPGGSFYWGCPQHLPTPSCQHSVASFRLDLYEVTVGRFRAFVEADQGTQASPPAAGAGANPMVGDTGWDPAWNSNLVADTDTLKQALQCDWKFQTWTDSPAGNERRPVNCVSWFEAFAFCAWDGGRLPTNLEWGCAFMASGGPFAWGSGVDYDHASYLCMGDGVPGCEVTDFIHVGSKPLGDARWGQADMTGNVWEWCADVSPPYGGITYRYSNGGCFSEYDYQIRDNPTGALDQTARRYDQGLRCARDIP